MVDAGFAEDEFSPDWENLLKNIPDEANFDLYNQSCGNGSSNTPDSGCGLSIDDIEQYLLNDETIYPTEDDRIAIEDAFLSDILLDWAPESESDRSRDSSGSPEVAEVADEEADERRENCADIERINDDDDVIGDDNDPAAKKRKRQMRNRDAAVRSRERKKMYVKDLEMKSKFYEAECRRLGNLLQCCVAENQALRLSLHTKAFGASMTKQESAVLVLESLLLGSLLGFLGILCLSILPALLPALEALHLEKNGEGAERGSQSPRKAGSKVFHVPVHPFFMGRKCKASKTRMKETRWLFLTQIIF